MVDRQRELKKAALYLRLALREATATPPNWAIADEAIEGAVRAIGRLAAANQPEEVAMNGR